MIQRGSSSLLGILERRGISSSSVGFCRLSSYDSASLLRNQYSSSSHAASQLLMLSTIRVCQSPYSRHSTPFIAATPRATTDTLNTTTVAIVRSFGKGSRMGNHITKLDDISHDKAKEEAKVGREKKKERSKPARLAAKKEDGPQQQQKVVVKQEAGTDDDDDDDYDDDDDNPSNETLLLLPTNDTIKSKMLLVITSLERSFSSIRGGGEVTPELFDSVRVSAYGELVPISSVGQVIIDDPRRVTISCFDPAIASEVRDAVRDMSTMNLSPYVEEGGSGVVIVPIPRVSDETRKEITKELGRQAENTRQRIRSIRRKAMDIVKRGKEGKLDGISKDDAFRVEKEIESVTKEILLRLDDIVAKKQKSVMED